MSSLERIPVSQIIDKAHELRVLLKCAAEDRQHYELLVGAVRRYLLVDSDGESEFLTIDTDSAAECWLNRVLGSG